MTTQLVTQPPEQVNVLGTGVHSVNRQSTASIVEARIREGTKGYICLAGVHGIMEAQRSTSLKSIFSNAFLVLPDGMPTVWMGHLQGFRTMERVFGPDLMIDIMSRTEFSNCSHFLCGGEPGVAESLRDALLLRFPKLNIVGTYSPPFREMTEMEEMELAAKVHALKPTIIWVGLSTPKQERFMARYLPLLDTHLMIGVGAAFLFHTGAIRDSPAWVKRIGLQWFHRLLQEPRRLWRRYVFNNPMFVVTAVLQILGLRRYTLLTARERPQS